MIHFQLPILNSQNYWTNLILLTNWRIIVVMKRIFTALNENFGMISFRLLIFLVCSQIRDKVRLSCWQTKLEPCFIYFDGISLNIKLEIYFIAVFLRAFSFYIHLVYTAFSRYVGCLYIFSLDWYCFSVYITKKLWLFSFNNGL